MVKGKKVTTKICKKCHLELDISNFYKFDRMKDGHINECKSCKNKHNRVYDKMPNASAIKLGKKRAQIVKYGNDVAEIFDSVNKYDDDFSGIPEYLKG